MSTDNAYVEADKVGVSTDVSGIVKDIAVTENQRVKPARFCTVSIRASSRSPSTAPRPTSHRLRLTIDAMKQDYRRMLSDVTAQQAQVALDQATYDRFAALLPTSAISKANYDQARFTLELDKNKLESLRQQAVQRARLAGNPDIPVAQHPQSAGQGARSTRRSASLITRPSTRRSPAS